MKNTFLKEFMVLSVFLFVFSAEDAHAKTLYVSPEGNNADGLSWNTAWNQLGNINWWAVQPGDVILLDGGDTEMVYEPAYASQFKVSQIGASGSPITIRLSTEQGRNGKVIIKGDRPVPLPYCGQSKTSYGYANPRSEEQLLNGIRIEPGYSWIVIDGMKWGGITIQGTDQGIYVGYNCTNITIRNVEIYDAGFVLDNGNGTVQPMGHGILVSGNNTNITFERVHIHDVGQDGINGACYINNLTVRQSKIYMTRKNPVNGQPFSYCNHPDGIQLTVTGEKNPVLIEDCIFTGWMQGVILGGDSDAPANSVTIRNTLFYRNTTNIMGRITSQPVNWLIENVTSAEPSAYNIQLDGTGHAVRNSIMQKGSLDFTDQLPAFSGNYGWNTSGDVIGASADPKFISASANDYALQSGSPAAGKGARVTSFTRFSELFPDNIISIDSVTEDKSRISVKHQNLCRISSAEPIKFQISGTEGVSELRIYTLSGKLVSKLLLDSGANEAGWDLTNGRNNKIKPGLYLYSIVDGAGKKKTGKVVISR